MVLTVTENCYVFHNDSSVLVGSFKFLAEFLSYLVVSVSDALENLLIHTRNALRSFAETFTVGVLTESDEDTSDVFFYCFSIHIYPFIRRAYQAAR